MDPISKYQANHLVADALELPWAFPLGNRYRLGLLLNSREGLISRRSSKRINESELIQLNSNKFAHLVGHSIRPHDSVYE